MRSKVKSAGYAYIESTHGGVLPAIERMQTRQVFAEVEIAFIAKLRQRGREDRKGTEVSERRADNRHRY
jgi:hypothetical protein